MFNPEADINNIHSRIRGDVTILGLLGLAGEPATTIAGRILKRSKWDELADNEKRLCVYFKPSISSSNQIITGELLQVDCYAPATQDYIAYRIQARINALLHNYEVNGRKYYFYGQLGELPAMDGFFCVGSRYVFYATI